MFSMDDKMRPQRQSDSTQPSEWGCDFRGSRVRIRIAYDAVSDQYRAHVYVSTDGERRKLLLDDLFPNENSALNAASALAQGDILASRS